LVETKKKVAVLDADLGQSDIGPPCTVGYAVSTKPAVELYALDAKNTFFVGVTTPSEAQERTLHGLVKMKDEILKEKIDAVLVNTDGWVESQEAVAHKKMLVEELKPDLIFCIRKGNELDLLLKALDATPMALVEAPVSAMERTREKRRSLRELSFARYLSNSKMRTLLLNRVVIEWEIFNLRRKCNGAGRAELIDVLGLRPFYVAKSQSGVVIVLSEGDLVDEATVERVEAWLKTKVRLISRGKESRVLLGLFDGRDKFLGLGILFEADCEKGRLKVLTPVKEIVSRLVVGRVWLDDNFKEMKAPWINVNSHLEEGAKNA